MGAACKEAEADYYTLITFNMPPVSTFFEASSGEEGNLDHLYRQQLLDEILKNPHDALENGLVDAEFINALGKEMNERGYDTDSLGGSEPDLSELFKKVEGSLNEREEWLIKKFDERLAREESKRNKGKVLN